MTVLSGHRKHRKWLFLSLFMIFMKITENGSLFCVHFCPKSTTNPRYDHFLTKTDPFSDHILTPYEIIKYSHFPCLRNSGYKVNSLPSEPITRKMRKMAENTVFHENQWKWIEKVVKKWSISDTFRPDCDPLLRSGFGPISEPLKIE